MRTIFVATVCLAGLSSLGAFAQQTPSLAITGVQATPVLIKKYPPQAAQSAAAMPQEGADTGTGAITGTWTGPHGGKGALDFTPSGLQAGAGIYNNPSDLRGDWKGTMMWSVKGRKMRRLMVLHLARSANGALSATLDDFVTSGKSERLGLLAPVVEYQTPRLRIKWPGEGSYEGVFMPGKTHGPSFAQGSPLEEVLHAIDVQLADRLVAMHKFTVLEEGDLKQAVKVPGGQSNQICNLKNPTIAEQYRNAGIDYLLVTTLEDFEDETLDLMQGKVQRATVDLKGSSDSKAQSEWTASRTEDRSKTRGGSSTRSEANSSGSRQGSSSFAVSGQATAAQLDSSAQKAQTVRLVVRIQFYRAASGTLLKSVNYPFHTNRTYVAVAGGSNSKATSDFYQDAAQNCAWWAASQITDVVFPIQVLDKNEGVITIDRGEGSGVKVGQVFRIYSVGKELRDPGTGKVLGHDETIVGKVAISELHSKFSTAKILDDTGIAVGAILRRP